MLNLAALFLCYYRSSVNNRDLSNYLLISVASADLQVV